MLLGGTVVIHAVGNVTQDLAYEYFDPRVEIG